MAKTGPTFARIKPARRSAGLPLIEWQPEGSSETGIIGAPVYNNAGYFEVIATNGTELYGFLVKDNANNATDGLSKSQIAVVTPGAEFVGSLDATLTAAMLGSVAALSVSASTWHLTTNTDVSSIAQCKIKQPALGYAVGDTDPLVIFTIHDANIQGAD